MQRRNPDMNILLGYSIFSGDESVPLGEITLVDTLPPKNGDSTYTSGAQTDRRRMNLRVAAQIKSDLNLRIHELVARRPNGKIRTFALTPDLSFGQSAGHAKRSV